MWRYLKSYAHWAVIAALFMLGEVLMDLLQPSLMRRIVDDGVLAAGENADALGLILRLGALMLGLVFLGGVCGSLNNAFTNLASQNVGNLLRKECFRRLMRFSFPQVDRLGAGALITRVTSVRRPCRRNSSRPWKYQPTSKSEANSSIPRIQ